MAKNKLIKCHKFGRFSYRYRDFYIQEVVDVSMQNKTLKVKLLDWIVMIYSIM